MINKPTTEEIEAFIKKSLTFTYNGDDEVVLADITCDIEGDHHGDHNGGHYGDHVGNHDGNHVGNHNGDHYGYHYGTHEGYHSGRHTGDHIGTHEGYHSGKHTGDHIGTHEGYHSGKHTGDHIGIHKGTHNGDHFGDHFGDHYGDHHGEPMKKCSIKHCDNDAILDGICAECLAAIDEGVECYGATTMGGDDKLLLKAGNPLLGKFVRAFDKPNHRIIYPESTARLIHIDDNFVYFEVANEDNTFIDAIARADISSMDTLSCDNWEDGENPYVFKKSPPLI